MLFAWMLIYVLIVEGDDHQPPTPILTNFAEPFNSGLQPTHQAMLKATENENEKPKAESKAEANEISAKLDEVEEPANTHEGEKIETPYITPEKFAEYMDIFLAKWRRKDKVRLHNKLLDFDILLETLRGNGTQESKEEAVQENTIKSRGGNKAAEEERKRDIFLIHSINQGEISREAGEKEMEDWD